MGGMTSVLCCLCGRRYSERDPHVIGEDGARFFGKPPDSYVCFWCFEAYDYDPSDPSARFQIGHA